MPALWRLDLVGEVVVKSWRLAVGGWQLGRTGFLLCLAVLLLRVPAAEADEPPPAPKFIHAASLITTPAGKKMVAIDGRTTPLFWADGVTQTAQLEAYASTGLNTVVVRLSWRLSQNGSLAPEDWQPQRAFAEAAARRGLYVVYSLPPTPFGMEQAFRVAADSNAYFLMWSAWAHGVIAELKDTPNLIGWMLPDDPRSLPMTDDAAFGKWLFANYGNIAFINRQWGTAFATLDDITLEATNQIINIWRGPGPITGEMTNDELTARVLQANARKAEQNFAFHPASLTLALYKWDTYRALLAEWARLVRESDAERLVISGRLPDYAQLLSLPATIDISMPDIQPGVAEPDAATHNPHAVAIARRGNRFAAVPVLATAASALLPEEALPRLLPAWADAALAHGAAGLGFSSWPELQANEALRRSATSTLTRLGSTPFAGLWAQAPVATAAILLTPLAEGQMFQANASLVTDKPRGLYGFGEDLVGDEPNNLVYALRWGTAFGGVDYLAPDDLEANQALNRYTTIFMPQALSMPDEQGQVLSNYVADGGVLVADLGIGAAQAEAQVTGLPAALAALFGVASPLELKTLTFNLQSLVPHPLFPTWSDVDQGRTGLAMSGGAGPKGAAFAGPLLFGAPLPGTIPLALAAELPQRFGTSSRRGTQTRLQRSLLTLRPLGNGYAIFAPFRLWNFWRPGDIGFDNFHGDLLARGAAVVQPGLTTLVPAPYLDASGTTAAPEIINFSRAVALLNHNPAVLIQSASSTASGGAPPRVGGGQLATVQTMGTGDFLWSGGICTFPLSSREQQLASGRPAPIAEPDDFEKRPQPVNLYAAVRPQEMQVLEMVPIRVQNLAGGPLSAHVKEYSASAVKLLVWPNATTVVTRNGEFQVALAEPGVARITLYDNSLTAGYRIQPGSRHRVTIADLMPILEAGKKDKKTRRTPVTQIVTADAGGRLVIEATGAALVVEINRVP
ncbi:MAG TPA: hypothetical protein VNA16_09280 [Abditibacteriaceae bacterium]|nr:hypothetical protein [Abditibacteriaceae bacterium]